MARPAGKHAIAFIFITLLLDLTSFGLIMPVLPGLIMELTGEGLAEAAVYGGAMLFVFALMQFIFSPIIGNLSDRFGRRPVLLISLLMLSVDYLIMAFAPVLLWLFIGRALSGIAGATMTTANAFIADVSPPEKRAQNFGLVGAAFGLGFILGPVIGGLLGEFGPRVPFYVAAALAFLNFIYGAIVLPESLPKENRRLFSLARANPLGAFMSLRANKTVIGLIAVFFLFHLAHYVYPAIWSYYSMEKFDWSPSDVGWSLGFVGVTSVIVQGVLLRWIVPWLGDERAAWVGMAIGMTAYAAYAFVPVGWMVFPIIAFGALGEIAKPAMRGIMSNQVPANAQGELQGATASALALTAILGPPFLTQLFNAYTAPGAPVVFPGAPFIASALLACLALITFLVVMRSAVRKPKEAGSTSP